MDLLCFWCCGRVGDVQIAALRGPDGQMIGLYERTASVEDTEDIAASEALDRISRP